MSNQITKWEYWGIVLKCNELNEYFLNGYGKDGWELVTSFIYYEDFVHLVFKRPLINQEENNQSDGEK